MAAAYFSVCGYNLYYPNEMYYDEVYFVKSAKEIIQLSHYSGTDHPPFGRLLIALNILIFGDHSWAWRLVSLFAGFGCLVVLYAIVKMFTKSTRIALFSLFLFSFDCVSLTQNRIGMLNATMLFLMLLSVWCMAKYVILRTWTQEKAFFWTGLCYGLAVGTRFIGLSIAAILFLLFFQIWQEHKNNKTLKQRLFRSVFYYLILTPFIVYESTYIIIPFFRDMGWPMIWKLQYGMWKYHLTLKQGHVYGSEWWGWPLMIRPIWYYYKPTQVSMHGDQVEVMRGILCIGNPVIFWLIPVAMFFAIWQLYKNRSWIYIVAVTGFFTQWLQWAPVTRVKFFHYIYTAVPFACIALALMLDKLWQWNKLGKAIAILYLILVAGMFVYWYPLLNGMQITDTYFRQHMWFKSWI